MYNLQELSKEYKIFKEMETEFFDTISSKIKEKRKSKKFTQEEMSSILNITRTNYNHIENGNVEISLKKFIRICLILDIKPEEILDAK